MPTATSNLNCSPWPHRVALLLAVATFPLIWVGGLVTTYQAGMAVPDWPTTYGYNLFLYPWQTWITGPWDLFIEHGHRLLGATVGFLAILLVAAFWRWEDRRWVRRLGILALLAVIVQGTLGGLRVIEDAQRLAMVHGCFGPAFFALAVSLATVTSNEWRRRTSPEHHPAEGRIKRLATASAVMAYVQLVLGAEVRHVSAAVSRAEFQAALVMHLVMAFTLTLFVLLLAQLVFRNAFGQAVLVPGWLVRPALILAGLLLTQLALGAATWLYNYGAPLWLRRFRWADGFVVTAESQAQALVTTAHVATGSLILVTAVALALRAHRCYSSATRSHATFGRSKPAEVTG